MPRPRAEMRRIREVLRLRAELGPNLSAIAAGARLARSTVRAYLDRTEAAGLDAAAADVLSDAALEAALFRPALAAQERVLPDWAAVDQELRRHKHVTRKLVWTMRFISLPRSRRASRRAIRLTACGRRCVWAC